MSRVHVVGSIIQDIVVGADRHPLPGETIRGTSLRTYPGGKGANQAIAAVRAGAMVSMIGITGRDAAGQNLTAYLRDSGVACDLVSTTDEAPTGTGLITVARGENMIVVVVGANAYLDEAAALRIGFEPDDVCVAQLETPVSTTLVAFRRARAAGATTMLNAAPAAPVSNDLLNLVDILVVNEHELTTVFDVAMPEVLGSEILPDRLSARFGGVLILTLGANGAALWNPGQRVLIPGHQVEAVDSTGAGDCFVGYLAAGLVAGLGLEQAARRANRAAAISVSCHGAASSIPMAAAVPQ